MKEFQRRIFVILMLLFTVTESVNAAPSISTVTPRGIQPGATTELNLTGASLNSPLKVWTSFAAEVAVSHAGRRNVMVLYDILNFIF